MLCYAYVSLVLPTSLTNFCATLDTPNLNNVLHAHNNSLLYAYLACETLCPKVILFGNSFFFSRQYIEDMIENGTKFLVFAHHSVMMDAICAAAEAKRTELVSE